jgi:adenylate kinase
MKTIVVLGKSGSGKDTQAEMLLADLKPSLLISTGDSVREMSQKETRLGERIQQILGEGGLLPAWLAAFLWERELANKFKGDEHLVFSSSPRRVEEAKELDEVLRWLNREPSEAFLLEIPDDESVGRIVKRSRDGNDNEENVRERLKWFNEIVKPVIQYYEGEGRIHRINGVGAVEDIHVQILDALHIGETH